MDKKKDKATQKKIKGKKTKHQDIGRQMIQNMKKKTWTIMTQIENMYNYYRLPTS